MKKTYLLLAAALVFVLGACNKENVEDPGTGTPGDVYSTISVPKENTALVVKFSGTKCPPCGGWGWTAWDEIRADNGSRARFVVAFDQNFVSELFITATAEDWKKSLAINSWPTFVANHVIMTKKVGTGIDVVGTKANIVNATTAHQTAPVIVNSGFKSKVVDNKMTLNIKTKFFDATTGDYYLGVYMAEDKIIGKQSGHPTPSAAEHHHTLRQLTGGFSYGEALASGSVAANTEFKKEVILDLDPSWNKANLEVLVVVWKKVGSAYSFVNCSKALK